MKIAAFIITLIGAVLVGMALAVVLFAYLVKHLVHWFYTGEL